MRPDVVVIPTYNEAATIGDLCGTVRASGYEVLVVDDGSPDGTGRIVDDLAAADSGISVLHRTDKSGLGAAYTAALPAALERNPRVVVAMDADLSHDPAAIPDLVAAVVAGAGLAIGSRYVPDGATEGWPWRRRLLSTLGNRYARFVLRSRIRDLTSGFRAWQPHVLAQVLESPPRASGYAFQIETAVRAERLGATVAEVPIVFRNRRSGVSKMSAGIAAEALLLVTRWGLRSKRRLP